MSCHTRLTLDSTGTYRLCGMSLTPVAPTGSGSVSGGLPSHAPGARRALRDRASVPRVLGAAPLGAGVRVPRLRRDRGVAHRARAVDVRGLWTSGEASVIAGTIFQGTRTPDRSLVRLVPGDLVGGQPHAENGASALGLQRVLGLGSYRTAWTWLHICCDARWCGLHRDGRDRVLGGVGRGGRDPRGRTSRRAEAADTWGRRRWSGHCGRGAGPGHRPYPDAANFYSGRCLSSQRGAESRLTRVVRILLNDASCLRLSPKILCRQLARGMT